MTQTIKHTIAATILGLTACAATASAESPAIDRNDQWVDVSHSLGFPLGGLGTGYSAFGKYGFVKVNFDGRPGDVLGKGKWEYTQEPEIKSTYGFVLTDRAKQYVLQTTPAAWTPGAKPFASATTAALLPKGQVQFSDPDIPFRVSVLAYTPLLPHDLATATIPAQIYEITVENPNPEPRTISMGLANSVEGKADGSKVVFTSERGQLAFAAADGEATSRGVSVEMFLTPHDRQTARFAIGWRYPDFDGQKRYYTKAFADAAAVVDRALRESPEWSQRIDAWHNSIQTPPYLKRMWFSSLSSVMTSSVLTAEPVFYEIETPHPSLNTMDVCIYSNWVYMVNWPELERMDMDQYFKAMPKTGEKAGLVYHSLWGDAAKYVEEPAFLARFYRDHLWYNDPEWSRTRLPLAVLAANRVLEKEGGYELLVNSKHGNQSYDIWRMPGISSYVNSAWLYGLYGLEQMASELGQQSIAIGGRPLSEVRAKATASYDKLLWNEKTRCWNLFYRTQDAEKQSTPDSVFSDQLLGKWVVTIDAKAADVLPRAKVHAALNTIYTHNLVEDKAQNFRGWCNGMLPDRKGDVNTGYHAKTFWFGPQINLASLLAVDGNEAAALDVMQSIERSLNNNHLAAGEWNRSVDKDLNVVVLPNEPEKDTPRFAPYPRYKSCWEWLPRILGMQMDRTTVTLSPFKTITFSLAGVELAGMKLTVKVESGWTKQIVDGKPFTGQVRLDRSVKEHSVEFIR